MEEKNIPNPKYVEKIMKNSEFYKYELDISDSRIKYFDKIIKENQKCQIKNRYNKSIENVIYN